MKSDNIASVKSFYCSLFMIVLFLTVSFSVSATPLDRVDSDQKLESLPLQARYTVSAAIGRDQSDFHIQENESGATARNNGQSYTVDFSDGGVTFRKGDTRWGMALVGWGYGNGLETAKAVKPQTEKNRVEYLRGDLTEWYVNGPMGLQQGFTIHSAPNNRGKDQTLQVRLKMNGGLQAKVYPNGRGLDLVDQNGALVFRYGGLTVFDADGKDIPARLTADAGNLAIDVDDRNAVYPLTIDPIVESAILTASDGVAGDRFGSSVAISGDTVVVGAQYSINYQGSAYVFTYSGGTWTESAKLTASDGVGTNAYFGYSVSIDGNTIVVGAYGGGGGAGSAYVFVKPGGGWFGNITESATLTASDGAAGDQFGGSVAISGDTVVVGAIADDTYTGSAYVFDKPGGGWSGGLNQAAKLTASDRNVNDSFGWAVSVNGDTIVVGAGGDDFYRGSAYVFDKPGGGWANINESAKLNGFDSAFGDEFGVSVSISGDTIVAGASGKDSYQGAAYVFIKSGGTWSQSAKLTASDAADSDCFGGSVSISGDTVVVGAYYNDDNGSRSGSAYVFEKPDTWANMTESVKLIPSAGANNAMFGGSISVSGSTIATGAFKKNSYQGGAYVHNITRFNLAFSGAGSGTIAVDPNGVNCTSAWATAYGVGETVTLTATPNAGSALRGWSDAACPGNGFCKITMDADKTVTATFETDTDGDGISDSAEDAGPNGGDGNGDGFLDSTQTNVSSFLNTNGQWCTMVSMGDLAESSASCNPSPGDIPAGVTPTCGFYGFKMTGLVAGGSAVLTIILHDQDTTINDYYKYGPTPTDGTNHWYQFLDDGTTGAKVTHADGKTYITLRLKDGGLGDDDLTANGTIIDVGGPMVSAGSGGGGSSSASSSSAGGGGGGGCFVTATD